MSGSAKVTGTRTPMESHSNTPTGTTCPSTVISLASPCPLTRATTFLSRAPSSSASSHRRATVCNGSSMRWSFGTAIWWPRRAEPPQRAPQPQCPRSPQSQIFRREQLIMMAGLLARLGNTRIAPMRRLVLVAAGVSVGTFQLCGLLGLRINTSPSLPVGLYIATTDGSANLVEFCPVEPFATLSINRGYRDPGTCRDGGAPLLKPVIAKAGDVIELYARGISVNGVFLSNTAPLTRDTKGRPLDAWPFGRVLVAPGTVWVASSYHPRSFDSRYFGPLSTAAIRGRLKAFLTL